MSVRGIIVLVLLLNWSPSVMAERNLDDDDKLLETSSHSQEPILGIFVEFGGSGITMLSINTDIQFALDTGEVYTSIGLRLGYGWQLYNLIMAPVMIIGSVGTRHRLEYGAGVVVKPFPHSEGLRLSPTTFKLGALVGYRYQAQNGGWLFRFAITPLYDTGNKVFFPMVGLSCGASILL